jgi:hypothetical protein
MWLTPNVVVASACRQPAEQAADEAAEDRDPRPQCHPHQPAKMVAHHHHSLEADVDGPAALRVEAARPAMAIGIAVRSATPNMPVDVSPACRR